ncbi:MULTISPECIES: hypothetical protein [Halomonadaceae]|uniref:hypothetical protein n=1 Tax=Halomonadaceae TaxID=28256 RepID=UPI001597FE96|nr:MULTISPECIES: hypothetical protein [Halomonas]QJQ94095.1 hypothetical protein HIO72_01515 [Halomonas sp. PA5]
MYKVGSFRLALLIGAALLAIMMLYVASEVTRPLLMVAVLWLVITAALFHMSYRWPARTPWQMVPSLLLAGLLWADPQGFSIWLWAFPLLMMLPQPGWMILLNVILGGFGWWQIQGSLELEQAALAGLILTALMVLGLARAMLLRPLWQDMGRRLRLIPGMRLWSARQLNLDLSRESGRSDREEAHSELLLLRTSRQRCWAMARQLGNTTERYESCYRLDRSTLAVLLLSPDPRHAAERRSAILGALQGPLKARAVSLAQSFSLAAQCRALDHQREPLVVIKETAPHA